MKFLVIQMVIVVLVCIFIAALSNLTELGIAGWIIAGSTGHALYRVYKHMHYSMKFDERKRRYSANDYNTQDHTQDFSSQIQYFMFDDATELQDK